MLKVLPNIVSGSATSAKCAEIYCQSSKDFTILCTFCEMKTFEFEDFLRHFKNIHFENDLLKTEEVDIQCTPYLNVNVKCETNLEEDSHPYDLNESMGHEQDDEEEEIYEDEKLLSIWQRDKKQTKKSVTYEKKHDVDWVPCEEVCASGAADEDEDYEDEEDNDDNDEDYKQPKVKSKKKTTPLASEFKCETCNKCYKTAIILKTHIKRMHAEKTEEAPIKPSREINCPVCAVTLRTLRSLDEHCLQEHGGMPCPHCDRKYKSRYELKAHLPRHTGVKSYVCDFENCGKSFYNSKTLHTHRASHTNFKKYICETCGYSCRVRETLRVHRRMHTGEKPYSCQLCGKRFASCSLLSEHGASHQTLRSHICDVCGASFTRQKSLYHHKHLHLGIKKYKCKLCGNAYAQAAGLAGHMRKHREEGHC